MVDLQGLQRAPVPGEIEKIFACGKGWGEQQNKPGKKRPSYYPNSGAGGLLTPPARVPPSLETKGSQSTEPCEHPQVQPVSGGRIETLISLKIYPVALGLVISFISFNLRKLTMQELLFQDAQRPELDCF